jgi:F-type H+-transporting ATPase subunit epsilon
MPDRIHLEVLTPERRVLDLEVDRVEIPGLDGELGILPGHTDLISQLKPAGLLTYTVADASNHLAISDGFVEVSSNRVVVLADEASRPEEIDLAKALKLKDSAESRLARAHSDPEIDVARASVELERAIIELQLAEKVKR